MKITLRSTDKLVLVDGVVCREWTGEAEGIPIVAWIHRIRVPRGAEQALFETDLIPQAAPEQVNFAAARPLHKPDTREGPSGT